MNQAGIIRKVQITEKGTKLACENQYILEVAPGANKIEIKNAVEEIFGVKVQKVNTLNMIGKEKRMGNKPAGRRKNWKKAMVQLTPDSKTIEFFEGMV